MNINQILEEVCKHNSIYDEIIDNILYPNLHLKGELLSEIAVGFIGNQKSVIKAWEGGYFKYYFINTVKNQVHSKTSSFYKITKLSTLDEFSDTLYNNVDDDTDIEDKMLLEEKYSLLEEALENTSLEWFQIEMLNEYYGNNKTYREIERTTGIDHCLVFYTVKKAKGKLTDYIYSKTNNKK